MVLTMEIGVTSLPTDGFATAIPETALVTDTAGVNTPSASVRLVPNRLCAQVSTGRRVDGCSGCGDSRARAKATTAAWRAAQTGLRSRIFGTNPL